MSNGPASMLSLSSSSSSSSLASSPSSPSSLSSIIIIISTYNAKEPPASSKTNLPIRLCGLLLLSGIVVAGQAIIDVIWGFARSCGFSRDEIGNVTLPRQLSGDNVLIGDEGEQKTEGERCGRGQDLRRRCIRQNSF